jgi:succinoglycan biosynthesis protein ExoA
MSPEHLATAWIVVPTLNEAAHIGAVISDLQAEGLGCPILVADGGSTDGTRAIVRQIAADNSDVRLIDNPDQTQAAAVNLGAALALQARARILVRIDAHARYPRGFVRGVIQTLVEQRADAVVTPLIATGQTGWQGAAARLQRCWLGHGGARHRRSGVSGWVEHGHHAAFRLAAFDAIDGYDTTFASNEDAEFDQRLTAAGGRIFLQTHWPVAYLPRDTPSAIWTQFLRNGRWRVATARKHRRSLELRQWLPVIVTIGLGLSFVGAILLPWLLYLVLAYAMALLALAARAADGAPVLTCRIAWLAALSHIGFGLGAIGGFLMATPVRAAQQPARIPA